MARSIPNARVANLTRLGGTADAASTPVPVVWQPSDMTTAAARTVKLGTRVYPVVLPSARDPRLHVAVVIITIHVLGQVALGFQVSVPQILAAILTCAVIEVALTFRPSGRSCGRPAPC